MILEIFIILAVLLGGSALMRTTGIRGWPLPALGFIAGICLQVIIGSIQAITALPTYPMFTIILTISLPSAWWLISFLQGRNVSIKWTSALFTCTVVIILVILLREANLVNWHTDTYHYLMSGKLLADNNYYAIILNALTKRLLALPLIHAPANLQGEYYLRSFSPLLAISTIMVFSWFLKLGLRHKLSLKYFSVISVSGILLLITNNRFVFNAFYINAHLLFAALLLIISGSCWLLIRRADVPARALLTMQLLAIPVFILTRAEAFIIAALALLPFAISDKIPSMQRAFSLLVFGISVTVWHSFLAIAYIQRGAEIPLSVSAPFALGIFSILVVPFLSRQYYRQYYSRLPIILETGLWLALFVFAIIQPNRFYSSLTATIENVIFDAGSWGYSLIILALLICGILVFTSVPDRLFLRFPLTTFIPAAFLLAHLRGGSYRVGDGDSLNRSFIHIVPLAILFIVSAVESERWELPEWLKNIFARFKTK